MSTDAMEVSSDNEGQSFVVTWSNHHRSLGELFENYFLDETYADCSLAVGTKEICAHKIILSACSPFFNSILQRHREKHPIIVIDHAQPEDLHAIVEYMYKGEVQVQQTQLARFLALAENLQIKGLVSRDEGLDPEPVSTKRAFHEAVKSDEPSVSEEMPEEHLEVTEEFFMDEEEEEIESLLTESNTLNYMKVKEPTPSAELESFTPLKLFRAGTKISSKAQELLRDGNVRLKCIDCGGLYKSEATYVNHYRYDCNKSHPCTACRKVFKNKRHLLDHVRDDCGRYHICINCNRQFTQKVNLTTHQKHYCRTGENRTPKLTRQKGDPSPEHVA